MNKSFILALKEVRTFLQDRGDLAFSLLLPVAVFALMYGAFGGQTQFHGTAYVVNEDPSGEYSQLLLDRLNEIEEIDVVLLTAEEADAKLERSDILFALYIPRGFSFSFSPFSSTIGPEVNFKQRGNGGQEGQIVAGIIRGVIQQIEQEIQVKYQVQDALSGQNIPVDQIDITVQKYLDREREHPTVEVVETAAGRDTDPVKQFLPGVVTMFVLFSISLNARSIVEERKKGTLERLMTTRLTAGQLFTGKFFAGIFRGFIQTLILLILAYLVFRLFTPLTFLETLVIALLFAAASSAIGLLIAVIARSPDAATWIAVFFTMFMTMLGGTFFTISPDTFLFTLSKLSINTYANDAVNTVILEGGNLVDAGLQLAVLAGVAVVGVFISRIFFRILPGGK